MNCFIVTWSGVYDDRKGNPVVDRQTILDALDEISEILNWRASTGAVFVVSESTATSLWKKIHEKLPDLHFTIAPISIETIEGWTDERTWEFIRNPRSA